MKSEKPNLDTANSDATHDETQIDNSTDDELESGRELDKDFMFRHACAFLDCAQYCETEAGTIEYRTPSNTIAGIVNSAFSCEVFIKTLLVANGKSIEEIQGHLLRDLWDKYKDLDAKTAGMVEEDIRSFFQSPNEILFDDLLDGASNAFVKWRYVYEKYAASDVDLNFMKRFRFDLREVCCRKLYGTTWENYKKTRSTGDNGLTS